ncbi:unnamed protein product [Agarophyton chilense]|eukprot:gb/GEZJ01002790.1/.p1 GENE.gb/GEZJ01002790.1/~~gb/GEZJ01002790.1/.p1  ORF type:complete len:472 (+),score=71.97 gb/GEZJ01002790.1/:763-2178(+)
MAPKQFYQDEKVLDQLLDNLLQTGQNENSSVFAPMNDNSNNFSQSSIHEKLATASGLLEESKICPGLPSLDDNEHNIREVLAYALTAVIQLCKCCNANANLRNEAERSVLVVNEELLRLKRLNEVKKEKILRLDTKIMSMKKQVSDIEKEKNLLVSNLTTECTELKTKCARSAYRVNHLSLEAKKREREYSQLQQRVHSLMAKTKRLSIEPQIVAIAGNNSTKAPCISRDKSLETEEREYQDLVGLSEDNSMNEVIVENKALRDLLRAVQEELDDCLISNPNLIVDPKTPTIKSSKKGITMDGEKVTGARSAEVSSSENVCSPQRGDQTSIQKNDQEDALDGQAYKQTTGDEHRKYTSAKEPKTPTEATYCPSPIDMRENSGLKIDANQIQHQQKNSISPTLVADAEVGTPVTGSPVRSGTLLSNLAPALSAEQMNLPFDMIRENLERSFDQKFELLRLAVLQVGSKSPRA